MKDPLGLYSVEAVAERLGVHVRTVRRYLREGRLRGTKIGKQYRVAAAALPQLPPNTVREGLSYLNVLYRVLEGNDREH